MMGTLPVGRARAWLYHCSGGGYENKAI